MKSSIIEKINSLPPLSKTITNINKVYDNPNASIHDMAKVIRRDPMIIANLLKAANSPLHSFAKEISNPDQAVSLFGMGMTRSIAISNSVRKLLSVDMQPYGVSSEKFAEISEYQASLMVDWYKQIDKKKADELYLATFLQEMGKILIASDIIQDDETISFASEIELTNNIAQVEKMYVGVTSSEVTAKIFEYWNFDKEFIDIIRYADNPNEAPKEVKEFSIALNIIKTILPINKPLTEVSINIGLRKARDAGYNHELLEDAIDDMLDKLEK